MINAFGTEQPLGNVLFAATFLITDSLSECEGKKAANRAVWIGIFTSLPDTPILYPAQKIRPKAEE